MSKQILLGIIGAILVGVAAFFAGARINFHPENQKLSKFPEQLVSMYARLTM